MATLLDACLKVQMMWCGKSRRTKSKGTRQGWTFLKGKRKMRQASISLSQTCL